MGSQYTRLRNGTHSRQSIYTAYGYGNRLLDDLMRIAPPRKPSILDLPPIRYYRFERWYRLLKRTEKVEIGAPLVAAYFKAVQDVPLLPARTGYVPKPKSATTYRPMLVAPPALPGFQAVA